jgi:hypothetical protein
MKPGSASPRYFDLDVALPRDELPEEIACDMYNRVGELKPGTIAQMQVVWHDLETAERGDRGPGGGRRHGFRLH